MCPDLDHGIDADFKNPALPPRGAIYEKGRQKRDG